MPLHKNHLFFGYGQKLTDEQRNYVNSIIDNQFTIVNASAGTGKTTLAVMTARYLQRQLIYCFSAVEERTLGHTKGTVEEKESKYLTPLKDALIEMGEDPAKVIESEFNLENMKNGNTWVKAFSHAYVRGMNIKGEDKLLIIDEAQNFSRGELKKVLSRVHDSVKVVMIGHDGQCDLKDSRKSGFVPYLNHYKDEPYVNICELTTNFRGKLASHADRLTW